MEEWRAIAGYEGFYEVSSSGRVRSKDRTITDSRGQVYRLPGRDMKVSSSGGGTLHQRVQLSKGGTAERFLIHRLVAQAFIPNPEGYPIVRHLDDNPLNNQISNLAWGTHRMNKADELRNGNNANANKTHCPQGHPYDADNVFSNSAKKTSRACRTCKRARDKEAHHERMKDPDYRAQWAAKSREQRRKAKLKPGYAPVYKKKPRTTPTPQGAVSEFMQRTGRFPNRSAPEEVGYYRRIYHAKTKGRQWAIDLWAQYRSLRVATPAHT